MGEKGTETLDDVKVRAAVLRILESREKRARFVTELAAVLARSVISADLLERALAELAGEGAIIMRDHFCADPHLAGVDLRIAALVQRSAGGDSEMNAIHAIDAAWDKWLAEYLANHRCT